MNASYKKEDEHMKKSEKSEEDQKAKDVDVKEHIDALTSGESDLSEEFKQKAATIFENSSYYFKSKRNC